MIRIHSVLLPALIYRACCLSPLPQTHTHAQNKGPRSIDEPNEESSCFSAYLLNSISPTRSPCLIHLSSYPSIYLSICPSIFLSFHIAIRPYTYPICSCAPPFTRYLSIHHHTGKQRYEQDRYSFQLTRPVLVMYSRFIYFPRTNTRPENRESNKMAAMV